MEEDELGTREELGINEYVACARCGRVLPKSSLALVPSNALEGRSEYEYLCSDCQSALADGEQDLPLSLP